MHVHRRRRPRMNQESTPWVSERSCTGMDAHPCLPRAFAPLPMVFASACFAFARLALWNASVSHRLFRNRHKQRTHSSTASCSSLLT